MPPCDRTALSVAPSDATARRQRLGSLGTAVIQRIGITLSISHFSNTHEIVLLSCICCGTDTYLDPTTFYFPSVDSHRIHLVEAQKCI